MKKLFLLVILCMVVTTSAIAKPPKDGTVRKCKFWTQNQYGQVVQAVGYQTYDASVGWSGCSGTSQGK